MNEPTTARISAQQVNARRQHTSLDYATVRDLVRAVQYSDRNRTGLSVAVRLAREHGMPWHDIAAVLDMEVDEARRRFQQVDAELALEGVEIPATPQVAKPSDSKGKKHQPPPPTDDRVNEIFAQIRKLTLEELQDKARSFAVNPVAVHASRRYRSVESVEREAVIITLYDRHDYTARQIAELVALSVQRISQIVGGYYDRMEAVWEQERKERTGSDV